MIRAEQITKVYGSIRAVDGINLSIAPGETYGLLGPNGAGKTTTLHILTGAIQPDSGQVLIDGRDAPHVPGARRKIGIAPQADSLYLDLTGEENLRFFGSLFGLTRTQLNQRIASALEIVGLSDRAKDRVSGYSGGMRRRLNLACALVHDPPIIVLDEPTAGVDPQSRNHLLEGIERLSQEGKTILYTTHYMEEAEKLCDRIGIVDHGKILDEGTVAQLIERHGGKSRVEVELASAPGNTQALPGPVVDGRLSFESTNVIDDAIKLKDAGAQVRSWKVEPPNLEGVFLNLTGRGLRD